MQMADTKIDKDFTPSHWLALQFVPTKKQTQQNFIRGMPQVSHGKSVRTSSKIVILCPVIGSQP